MEPIVHFIQSKGVPAVTMIDFNIKVKCNDTFTEILKRINSLNRDIPGFPFTATYEEYTNYLATLPSKESQIMKSFKEYRNSFLEKSDWVMTYDNTQTLANLDDWIQYRQKLRDFFSDPEFKLILKPNTEMLDMVAMKFPPEMPPVIRK
jgi:hypothetical protein